MTKRSSRSSRPLNSLRSTYLRLTLGLCAWIALGTSAFGQSDPWTVPVEIREETLKAKLDAAQGSELDAERKAKVVENLQAAIDRVRDAKKSREQYEQYTARVLSERLAGMRRDSEAFRPQPVDDPPAEASLPTVEASYRAAEGRAKSSQETLAKLDERAAQRAELRAKLSSNLQAARTRLTDARENVKAATATEPVDELTEAIALRSKARALAFEQEVAALSQRLDTFEQQGQLLSAERELEAKRDADAKRILAVWGERLKTARERETRLAQLEAERARAEVKRVDPRLTALAEKNAELAAQRAKIKQQAKDATQRLREISTKTETIRADFDEVKNKVSAVGLTDAVGQLLRRQLQTLPSRSWLSAGDQSRREAIAEATLDKFRLEKEKRELLDLADEAAKVMQTLEGVSPAETAQLSAEVTQLLRSRQDLYRDMLDDLNSYQDNAIAVGVAEQSLDKLLDEFRIYIEERVLWIRSTQPVWRIPFGEVLQEGQALVTAERWSGVASLLRRDPIRRVAEGAAFLLLVASLLYGRRRLRRVLQRSGEQAAQRSNVSLVPTVVAALITALLVLILPLFFGVGALIVHGAIGEDPLGLAIGQALMGIATLVLAIETFRQQCRPNGLGRRHFDWVDANVSRLRHRTGFLLTVLVPLTFVMVFLAETSPLLHESLGRVCFIVAVLFTAFYFHGLLRPEGLTLRAQDTPTFFERVRPWSHGLAMLVPIALIGLAIWGYFYTAMQIARQCFMTACLFISLALVNFLTARFIRISKKRLLFKQREERLAAAKAAAESAANADGTGASIGGGDEGSGIEIATEELNVGDLDAGVRTLLRTGIFVAAVVGLFFTWKAELPALGALDTVELWPNTVETTEVITRPDGTQSVEAVTRNVPTTLADLLLSVAFIALTILGSRHVPALLELTVLQRASVSAGERYAVTTVVRYVIVGVGISLAFSSIGFGWSRIQWLVAALSVRLGFGLQEIFANFVSGLIILFERPIRLGDIVTIDNVSGRITKIRIRSTTITDFDRKEYIVPNKEFVTGRLLNWTLSDTVNRIVVNVGVAYGSDTAVARSLLLEAARETPEVLQDPEPVATFEGFGDSALNLVLRCFLPNMDQRLATITGLHQRIDEKFKKAGISIPFPQRDLHLKSGLPKGSDAEEFASPEHG